MRVASATVPRVAATTPGTRGSAQPGGNRLFRCSLNGHTVCAELKDWAARLAGPASTFMPGRETLTARRGARMQGVLRAAVQLAALLCLRGQDLGPDGKLAYVQVCVETAGCAGRGARQHACAHTCACDSRIR